VLGAARDVIKDEIGGKLPSRRPFRPDVRARPRLSRERGFTRRRVFTVRGREKKIKKKLFLKNKIKFFGSCCRLGKREDFFNFQFSIPKIPKLPKLPEFRGLHGRSREKKKVFST
jgi:hypothetical protein